MENANLFGQGDADTSKHHGAAGVYFVGLSGVWDAFCRSCTRDLIIPNTIIFGQRGTLAGTYQVCIVVRYSRDRYCYCANPYQAKISALYSTDRQLHHHYEKLVCSGQGTSLPKNSHLGYPKCKSRVRETSSRVPERPPGTGTATGLVPCGRRQVQRRRLAWPRAAKVLSCRPVCFVRTEGHECPDAWLHTALGWARPAWRPPGLPPVRLVRPVRRPRRPRRGRPPRCRNAKFTGLAKLGSPVQVGPIFLE